MAKTTRVPVTIENIDGDGYHIFTTVIIERQPFRALIDTGASKTVISSEVAARLNEAEVLGQQDSTAKGIGNEEVTTGLLLVKKIRLGKIKLENLIVGQIEFGHITSAYSQLGIPPFEVIIGGDMLRHFKAVISYEKEWLKLRKP